MQPTTADDSSSRDSSPREARKSVQALDPLPPLTRILIVVLGWLLILVGLAGLVLPGIQGVLTLLLGAACLSQVSDRVLALLRRLFSRWPRGWRRLLRLRRKLHGWLASSTPIADRSTDEVAPGSDSPG